MLRHTWAWLSSILLHAFIIFVLFFLSNNWQGEFLPAGDFDLFYLNSSVPQIAVSSNAKPTNIKAKQKNKIIVGNNNVSEQSVTATSNNGSTTASSESNSVGASPTFGNNETKKILSQIRKKIEKSKHYPVIAKNKGIEGTTQVRFQINNDGSIKNLFLSRSSGFEILDESALQAVKLAAPYPYYFGPIQFDLKFQILSI